ncbi:uncharacterized protein LOC124259090 [Haliotis rubra]|uniref:uncharacterized protein LOC124259090 n=1 Tax=Haliotis rubra TaxID=36100 RepID=UPI001EE5858D|nr:uncharacterized protein LOC124259090 [Haliotis rubra]
MQSSISLLCLVVLVCAHSTMSDTQDTLDTKLSRPRRSVDDIVDGLTNKFSKYLSSIFDLDEDDFKDILKALGKLKLAVLKAILNKFFDLKDKHHDFGSAQNVQRVSQMMESLEENIQQRDILDGLTTKFSKYLPSIFKLDEDDFKDILKALGKLKLAVLKALLNKFFDLKDKHHDFGSAQNVQRVSQMMESLEENIQQRDILDGLTTKFSKYLPSIFKIDEDDFKDILKALGKLKLAVLKALLNKFFDLKDKHHDFGSGENFQRVSLLMESLEENIQQQELASGASATNVAMTSLMIPLLPVIAKVIN